MSEKEGERERERESMEPLTGEVDGEARLCDVEVSLELDGDQVERGVDALGDQGAAHLPQGHLVVRGSVPHLQDVVGGLRVEGQELEAGEKRAAG